MGSIKSWRYVTSTFPLLVPSEEEVRTDESESALQILGSQQRGLDHLTKVLNGMKVDTDTMNEAFGLPLLGGKVSE